MCAWENVYIGSGTGSCNLPLRKYYPSPPPPPKLFLPKFDLENLLKQFKFGIFEKVFKVLKLEWRKFYSSSNCTWHNFQENMIAFIALHIAHCTLHTAHCKVHSAHCTVHTAQCTLHSAHCTVHIAHYTVHNAQCTMHNAHCSLHTALYTLSTMYTAHRSL